MKTQTNERRELYCVAFRVLCQECVVGLFKCAFCLVCWPCVMFQAIYCSEDNTSNYNEDVRMFRRITNANRLHITKAHANQDEPESEDGTDSDNSSEWSDDSSQWFTARNFTHKTIGAHKNQLEELIPLNF